MATTKPKTVKKREPWYDTALDLSKVLNLKDGQLYLAGKPVEDRQLAQLKADAQVIEKLPLWSYLIETLRQYAIDTGFNKSQDFEGVKVAKAMLLILDTQRQWTKAIAQAKSVKN